MLALVLRKWAQERDRKKAIGALFSGDSGLGAYPGPAAYLGRDGAIIVANNEEIGRAHV